MKKNIILILASILIIAAALAIFISLQSDNSEPINDNQQETDAEITFSAFFPGKAANWNDYEIAKEIMTILQKNKTTQDIIEELNKEYDIPEQELYIDVCDFISKLKIYNLI